MSECWILWVARLAEQLKDKILRMEMRRSLPKIHMKEMKQCKLRLFKISQIRLFLKIAFLSSRLKSKFHLEIWENIQQI